MVDRPTARWRGPAVRDLVAAAVMGAGISLSLSALLVVATVEQVSRLPMPLAVAFAAHLFGKATLGMKLLLPVGLLLHVGYVSTATLVAVAALGRRRDAVRLRVLTAFGTAFGTALALWVLAGLSVLPYVGWGPFALGLGAGAAVEVLAVHLLYGAFLWAGLWLVFRRSTTELPPEPAGTPIPAAAAAPVAQ
ncbi:hypothetical protein SAMN05661080_00520 [Modestobacter sp. DSM 44400]|uniref:hypothetical protein n=1 Tax=Modestobacter sp. DSM 44400 TaxID=1550230 RepID=UPI00089562E6|nr:hypothetical protein [Modestobacter sp. DSM 44400]SDX59928.1 hypothetical protein SAMN05661080_00520 [Modestobacter sp. DSM 44400]